MTQRRWWTSILIIVLTTASAGFAAREESTSEHDEHAEQEAHEGHAEAGETSGVVTLNAEALAKSGVVVSALASSARPTVQRVTGTVIDRQVLLELCRRYAAARKRAPDLLPALEADVRARWGERMAQAMSDSSSVCAQLAEAGTLIEVTQDASAPSLPQTLQLEDQRRGSVPTQQLSSVEKSRSPAQVHAFFLAPGPSGALSPGETVTLRSVGEPKREPAQVPESAVVWVDGKSWVYVQEGNGRFERRELPGIAPKERIVVNGAQTLLSQEFRSQIHVEEEGGHEEGEEGEHK